MTETMTLAAIARTISALFGLLVEINVPVVPKRVLWFIAAGLCASLSISSPVLAAPSFAAPHKPQRIVSTNLCIDQLVLLLVPRERIVGLSYLSSMPDLSNVTALAKDIPIVHANAEEVLLMKPDMIFTSTYTNRDVMRLMKKFGVPVITVDTHVTLDGIRQQLRELGAALGEEQRAAELIRQLDFPPLDPKNAPLTALSYSAGGASDGANTLMDSMLKESGFLNMASDWGLKNWGYYPLEEIVLHPPALLVTYEYKHAKSGISTRMPTHPVLRDVRTNKLVLSAPPVLCPGPWNAQVVQQLRRMREML